MGKQKKTYFRPESSVLLTDFEPLCHVQVGSGEYQNGMDIDIKRRSNDEDWASVSMESEGEEMAYGSLW